MSKHTPKAGVAEQPPTASDAKPATSQPQKNRRMSAQRKQEAVLRLLKGEDLDLVSREVGCTASDLSGWRDNFLEGGTAAFRSRTEDERDRKLKAMAEKIGMITMENELLYAKVEKLEKKHPFALRGLRR